MINEARRYQAFYTRSIPIVDYMVNKLSLKVSDNIFEPCGGDGVFVEAILAANKFARIAISELNVQAIELLKERFHRYPHVTIRQSDTLLDKQLSVSKSIGIYDKIIANPPYGAWQDQAKRAVLKKKYPGLYVKESYGLFLFRCIELLKEGGILSFIIPDTFLNLHRHDTLRQFILTQTKIVELVLFPSSFFPGVNFGYANLSIITLQKSGERDTCLNNRFCVLSNFSTVEQLAEAKDERLNVYSFLQQELYANSGHAFLIADNAAVSRAIVNVQKKIGDIAHCVTGFYSGDDKQSLRAIRADLKNGKRYNLVDPATISASYKNTPDILEGLDHDRPFIPIVKGGNTKYLKPENWFMNWSKEAVQRYKKDKKARFQNPNYYFRFGIGVPMVSSSKITAALIENKLFDQSIVGVFPKDEDLTYYLLAFFNSPTCNLLIRTINPSVNNPANYIKRIPFIMPDEKMIAIVTERTKNIITCIRATGSYDHTEEMEMQKLIRDLYGF